MKVKIEKGLPSGEIKAPPSKSYAHRLLICSALSGKDSSVTGIAQSEDMLATLDCISSLGVDYSVNNQSVQFIGKKEAGTVFNCRESGSTLRFFIPIALARGGVCEFRGTERLISRGISIYEEICKKQGISLSYTDTSITFDGALKPDTFEVRGDISSQFISGLFFALPLLDGDSTVKITTELESKPYIDITIDALSRFGVRIEQISDREFFIRGKQKYISADVSVEGDFSNSAFLEAFGVLGTDISVIGLYYSSLQGDKIYKEFFKQIKNGYFEADISSCPDLGPILIALCAARDGGYITGTRRLKIKESDRAEAMASELAKLGIRVDVLENAVKIHKGELQAPVEELSSHNDHRIAMSLAVLATLTGATINGAEAVSKSYPSFFEDISSLGVKCEVINENN
ncbi:MAG: 3-phosphoshikimate 1-carboxyvinyltransferase [Clostridia bacterium]|nr:3-phosphoshikimate 1-carboxyvinyltransferase [Clostridia bacterium]